MAGQCPACGEWNTLIAEAPIDDYSKTPGIGQGSPDGCLLVAGRRSRFEQSRLTTGSTELDRVLGGGLVPGSVTLIGGDPGIGKSTLMLQRRRPLNGLGPVLYATGEESLKQVALRARRLGLEDATARLMAETCVEEILDATSGLAARVLIVDSIQTMHSERIESARARSPSCASARRSCALAKASGTAVLLVGHVTKEGQIAGPRVLEHMSTRCCTSRATPAAATACCAR